MLLFLSVTFCTWFAGYYLLTPLLVTVSRLQQGLHRCRRYLFLPLTELREKALRQRTLLLLRQLANLLAILACAAIGYAPALLVAHQHTRLLDAFASPTALGGMLTAALGLTLWRRRS